MSNPMFFSQDVFVNKAKKLGRSQDFINITVSYAETLQKQKLPVIFSTNHLCQILGVPFVQVDYIINNREECYEYYTIKKRNGGIRQIMSPHNTLKYIQRFIKDEILDRVPIHECATAFVKDKSIKDNASIHQKQDAILNIDFLKFFDSINERRIYGIFNSFGYSKNLCYDFAKLTTSILPEEYINGFKEDQRKIFLDRHLPNEGVLIQGAPTSPALSNLVCRRLDKRLHSLALKNNLNYTRYADDVTFSGKLIDLPKIQLLELIINDEGLALNKLKTGIYKKGRRQRVTGLNISDGVHVPRKFKKEVKKNIYCCLNFGVENHIKHMQYDKGLYRDWLLGKIFYIKSIEPDYADKLLNEYNKIIWPM